MNVSSMPLSTVYTPTLNPASTNKGAAVPTDSAAAAVSLLAKDASSTSSASASSTSQSSSASSASANRSSGANSSSPAVDVAKSLKELDKELIAVQLIQDPVARAKAAANLYKQYAGVAQRYASASAPAQGANPATQTAPADGTASPTDGASATAAQAAGSSDTGASPDSAAAATTSATDVSAAVATPPGQSSATAAGQTAPSAANGAASAVTPPAPVNAQNAANQMVASLLQGPKPTFVPDLNMEEIKSFANMAKQIYDQAVQEAKAKGADTSKLKGAADEIKGAQDELTKASQAMEGSGATATGGYTSNGVFESASTVLSSFSMSA